jgi:hypothetical protein
MSSMLQYYRIFRQYRKDHPDIRKGQAASLVLKSYRPDLMKQIVNTPTDPWFVADPGEYYEDGISNNEEVWKRFVDWLYTHW